MKDPRTIAISDYTYTLPPEQIAVYPLATRDASRLLIYQQQQISESTYAALDQYIPSGTLLVFNNTKVVEARLLFQKPTGGVIEIFCLEPHEQYGDITQAMQQQGRVYWLCLVGGASKWKAGQVLEKSLQYNGRTITLQAHYIEKRSGCFCIELQWTPENLTFAELLHAAGAIPLPPYIKRTAEKGDTERYQTVYAAHDGSVAAPTAGLHFTPALLHKLDTAGIHRSFVTLHVGAGTFQPVKAASMDGHTMHAEWIDVSATTIQTISNHLAQGVVAVGTTSLRTLESLYWFGVKAIQQSGSVTGSQVQFLEQWEVYDLQHTAVSPKEALDALLRMLHENGLERLIARTQILIAPGYRFRMVKGLITNFHQPQSTLLLLVAALIGDDWKNVYTYALDSGFRFLSYGDGSLLWGNQPV